MGAFVDSSISYGSDGTASTKLNDFNWFTTKPEDFTENAQLAAVFGIIIKHYPPRGSRGGIHVGAVRRDRLRRLAGHDGTTSLAVPPRSPPGRDGKQDGVPTGGTVQALLSAGEKAVDPSSTPIPVDAVFEYSASDEPNKTGTVSLEARSKRGVGRVDINFDTNQTAAYQVVGGLDDWQTDTAVCDIMKPFVLTGILTMNFTGGLSGSYEYSGGPFDAAGSGTYEISLPNGPGQAGTMTGTGEGSVRHSAGSVLELGDRAVHPHTDPAVRMT